MSLIQVGFILAGLGSMFLFMFLMSKEMDRSVALLYTDKLEYDKCSRRITTYFFLSLYLPAVCLCVSRLS